VVVDHDLDIMEDLAITAMSLLAGLGQTADVFAVEGAVGRRVEHEGHGQQALDPFYELVSPVRLEGVCWS
jgi:hypothetical protein